MPETSPPDRVEPTEATAAPEEPNTSAERWRALAEALPHTTYERDLAGDLSLCSGQIEALTGYTSAALLAGRPGYLELVLPEDVPRLLEAWASVHRSGARLDLEYRLVDREGAVVPVADHGAVRRDASSGELVIAGVLIDRRELARSERERAERARLETLGGLSAGVAHEVNNPLSGVLNYAELAQRLVGEDPRLHEALAGITAEGRRILEVTQALLTFARRGDDGAFRPLPPGELVRGALTVMRRQLRDELVTLTSDVPPDLPPLRARGHELHVVLRALLLNARQALAARFPRRDPEKRLVVRVRHEGDESPPMVAIEVEDRGAGLEPDVAARAFLPYFSTRPGRVGLGLTLAGDVVRRHGGTIAVQSEAGRGTTVAIRIPAWDGLLDREDRGGPAA